MGISFECKVKGLYNLENRVNQIARELPQKVEERIEEILKNIKDY